MDQDNLKQVTEALEKISDLLYQNNVEYAYKMLAVILGEMGQVICSVEDESIRKELTGKLSEALQAMEDGDAVLMADILQYEINERLLELMEE